MGKEGERKGKGVGGKEIEGKERKKERGYYRGSIFAGVRWNC